MTVRLLVALVAMCFLLGGAWQAPRLLSPDDELQVLLRLSWLICVWASALLASWAAGRLRAYGESLTLGLALGFAGVVIDSTFWFRFADVASQVLLLLIWVECALRAPSTLPRAVAFAGCLAHGWMLGFGTAAKLLDPGFIPLTPDVLVRAYGPTAALLVSVPVLAALVGAAWVVERLR